MGHLTPRLMGREISLKDLPVKAVERNDILQATKKKMWDGIYTSKNKSRPTFMAFVDKKK